MQESNKVNWLRKTQFANGVTLSVSDSSGIVKIELPESGRRSPMLYTDEIKTLLGAAIQIQQFLEQNQDVCFTKDQSKDSRTIKRNQTKSFAKAAEALTSLSPEQMQALAQLLQNKVG